jgi:hypothetical protein
VRELQCHFLDSDYESGKWFFCSFSTSLVRAFLIDEMGEGSG